MALGNKSINELAMDWRNGLHLHKVLSLPCDSNSNVVSSIGDSLPPFHKICLRFTFSLQKYELWIRVCQRYGEPWTEVCRHKISRWKKMLSFVQ